MRNMPADAIAIVPFRDEHAAEFARLNQAWLVQFDIYEPIDGEYLDDPRGHILEPGGEIFCAVRDGRVIGTCALLAAQDGVRELAKLVVAPDARGHRLGRRLTEHAIEAGRRSGARRIVLSSNSRLKTAIALYEELGFRHVPPHGGIAYDNADTFMALDL